MTEPYNFFAKAPSPQALAAAMMPADSGVPAFSPQASSMSMPSIDAQSLFGMSQRDQNSYSPLSQAWDYITNQSPGNPLGLTSGTKFTPDDKIKLMGAFNG